jgi:hypothetical protein
MGTFKWMCFVFMAYLLGAFVRILIHYKQPENQLLLCVELL